MANQVQSTELYIGPMVDYDEAIVDGIFDIMPYLDETFTRDYARQDRLDFIKTSLELPDYYGQLVAVDGGIHRPEHGTDTRRVIGAVSMSVVMGSGFGKRGHMEDVIVDPNIQGRGIGLRLMTEGVDAWCIARRLSCVAFESELYRERALNMYEKWGAQKITDDKGNGIEFRKFYAPYPSVNLAE